MQERWTVYKLVNSGDAFGVATLIRNEEASQNNFRMLGSITFGNNYIEIVPVITKEQQARKKRSVDENSGATISEPADFVPQYDSKENTHMVEIKEYPEFTFAEPLKPGK